MAIKRVPTPAGDPAWLVTDYDQVKTLLADRRLGRSHEDPDNAARFTESALFGKPRKGTLEEENEIHAHMRRTLAPSFSARHMESLRPRVRQIVVHLLDELAGQPQPADFHEAVSFPLPVLVICELLGVPFSDRDLFRGWSEDVGRMNDEQRSQDGFRQLWGYTAELVRQKRAEPADDVISRMVELEEDDEAVAQMAAGLLFAGHETTVAAIDRGVMLLSLNPGQWDTLRADLSQVPAAVEEILRVRSPLSALSGLSGRGLKEAGMPRYALADIDLDGHRIAKGDLVMLGLDQANLDEQRFPCPAAFDPGRTANPHLTFGFGPRFCVGAPLARIELTEIFTALLRKFTTFGLAVDLAELSQRTDLLIGGVSELPVRWTPA